MINAPQNRIRQAFRMFLVAWTLVVFVTMRPIGASAQTGESREPSERPRVAEETAAVDSAEESEDEPGSSAPDDPANLRTRKAEEPDPYAIDQQTQRYIESGQNSVSIYRVVQEMVDEFIADSRDLRMAAVSPVALRNVGLSPNLSKQFGFWVESQIITAINRHTDMRVKRCIACSALKTRVEGRDWVVALGLNSQDELREEAERLGVSTFLDAFVAFIPGANTVTLTIQIFRASDGKVLWSETYQSDSTTAAILRTGDRVISRDEARAELVRKIEARPYYGHILYLGSAYIPYDSPAGGIQGASVGYRLYEKFGEMRRWMFGIGGEGFLNFTPGNELLGSFVSGTLMYQLNEPNLNDPIYRTGPAIGGFIAGTEGNSFVTEWLFDVVLQFRLGAGASVFYFVPTEFAGANLGGFGFKGRLSWNW